MGRTRSGDRTPTVLGVGARILLVEDDRDLRELLVFALESDGHSVRTAENGVEALVQLEFGPRPDVILLNLVLPLMLGSELLESLRQDPRLAHIPVILITGAPVPVDVATLANAVLPKPFGLDQLAEAIVGIVPRDDPSPAPRPPVNP
jgi:two-component system, chemotaxis family, chemotaxis protein CheY